MRPTLLPVCSVNHIALPPGSGTTAKDELVSDDEIDRMIQADVLAAERKELGKLDELESEMAKELGANKQND